MCGIAGFVYKKKNAVFDINNVLDKLKHRGPDARGYWSYKNKIFFLHTRLSVIDLKKIANQPLKIENSQYVIIFNGEIYNYKELKFSLKKSGEIFFTDSDTEVLLVLWKKFGIKALSMLRGMFSFAIFDKNKKEITLCRDPIGIKPLFYSYQKNIFSFSSEINVLKNNNKLDSLGSFFAKEWGCVPSPFTTYKDIKSVEPGTIIKFSFKNWKFTKKKYWCLSKLFNQKINYVSSYNAAIEISKRAIHDSLRAHFTSDVPVAILLSGGIDSSSLVSVANKIGIKKINTISLIFPGTKYNEDRYIKLIVKKFKTNHYQKSIHRSEFIKEYKKYIAISSYPTTDGFNIYLVTKFAKSKNFKVLISGIGADEIFQGYDTVFKKVYYAILFFKNINKFFKKIFFSIIRTFIKNKEFIPRIKKIIFSHELYNKYLSARDLNIFKLEKSSSENVGQYRKFLKIFFKININCNIKRILSFFEIKRYLQTQLLIDCDYYSMRNSVEIRTPFVDKIFYENIIKINPIYFYFKSYNKNLLVDAVEDIPNQIIFRKKMGFTLPLHWIPADIKKWQ